MLVAVSALSVILVNRAREDNDWVVHTLEVENQISTLLLRIRTTESAARGYLLTEEQRFLDEYQATAASVHSDIDQLLKLAGDNAVPPHLSAGFAVDRPDWPRHASRRRHRSR